MEKYIGCKSIIITNNNYYKSVIHVDLGPLHFQGNVTILNNHMRNVFYTLQNSYTTTDMCQNCVMMIAQNTVYSVLAKKKKLTDTYNVQVLFKDCTAIYFQPYM